MDLIVERQGDVAVVTLPMEDLDASNAGDLKRDAAPILESQKRLVFDLSRVKFIDSSGLGAFLSCLRRINEHNGELKLCAMSKHVRSVFELVRMHRIFQIYGTCAEAVQSFEQGSPTSPGGEPNAA